MLHKKIFMLLSVLFCSVAFQVHSTPNKVKLVDKNGISKIVPFDQKTMTIVYKEKNAIFSTAVLKKVADTQKILIEQRLSKKNMKIKYSSDHDFCC